MMSRWIGGVVPPPSPDDAARRGGRGLSPPDRPGLVRAVVREILPHPSLYPTALRQAVALAPRGWWRAWPPLPVPDATYLRFRLETAYGGDGAPPRPGDVVTYLRWCRQWRRLVTAA